VPTKARYIIDQIKGHCLRFLSPDACRSLVEVKLAVGGFADILGLREPCLALPDDLSAGVVPEHPCEVPFNGTQITVWNRVPVPEGDGWTAIPDHQRPLWYRHESGTVIPAFDLVGNLFNLLTFREELEISRRDRHDRFIAGYSPRLNKGLLEKPAFNEGAAVLAAAALGLRHEGYPRLNMDNHVRPPVVVLSHDCDLLRGNDLWTQGARMYRMLAPVRRGRLPHLQNVRSILRNAVRPYDHYLDNIRRLVDLESSIGYRSSFYLLNGAGGRYGARSRSPLIEKAAAQIPETWPVGMHYNYDTYRSEKSFAAQKIELEAVAKRLVRSGRAHYLRLDPESSLRFWASQGITIDETAGYPDRVGYRCGIGGCFQPYEPKRGSCVLDIWEVPLVVMDTTLSEQYGADAVDAFDWILGHLKRVGGAVSLLYHPDQYLNPEFPETYDLYPRLLEVCRKHGAVSKTAVELALSLDR